MQQDPIEKKKSKNYYLGGKLKIEVFKFFLRKNLKLKNAYFGPFLIKNEKKKDGF